MSGDGLPRVRTLAQVTDLVLRGAPVFVRFSAGPAADRSTVSVDHESGCVLPGLGANPLVPEPWWDRPVEHWVARTLSRYAHLLEPDRFPWLLRGEVSGRGPDGEPLLVGVRPVAAVAPEAVEEAARLYGQVFAVGADGA